MSNMPLVSVIIPLYNYGQYIEASINSVISQTYKNLQIIVVNDGSTDNSLEVARSIKDSRIEIVNSEKNQGNSKTMNLGLQHVKGEYIKYIDADDMMNPEHIEEQLKLIIDKNNEIASCKWGRFTGSIDKTVIVPERTWKSMDTMTWIKTALSQDYEMTGSCLWLIPKKIADKAGSWNEELNVNNDFEYSTRILMAADKVNFSANSMIYYRDTPGSVTRVKGHRYYTGLYNAGREAVKTLLHWENSPEMRRLLANRFQIILYDMYPQFKDLQKKLLQQIEELGGSSVKLPESKKVKLVADIIGWKLTKRLQFCYYRYILHLK